MEVKETAACGISLREFAIEIEDDEIVDMYRIMNFAQNEEGFYDEDFLDDLKSQMSYIIGPSVEEDPVDDIEETIHWEDDDGTYSLCFTEPEGPKLLQILDGVNQPGEGFDKEMNQKLLEQMRELASSQLENLPVINR
jgi:hypothetical protein